MKDDVPDPIPMSKLLRQRALAGEVRSGTLAEFHAKSRRKSFDGHAAVLERLKQQIKDRCAEME